MRARARWALPLAALALILALGGGWLVHWRDRSAGPAPGQASPGVPAASTAQAAAGPDTDAAPPAEVRAVAASGVHLRLRRAPRIDTPSPPYAATYARLRAGAETAAPQTQYRLGLLLYECRDVPSDEAGLARQIDQLYQTRKRNGWDVENPGEEERELRSAFADCAGVPAAARGEFRDWMRRAADGGLIDAQLNLMFHLPRAEYCQFIEDCTPAQAQMMAALRDEARAQVGKALQAGSVEALRTVGGWALNEEMGTPDDVEAYACFSAYDQIQQAAGREREMGAMLSGIKARLRPVDLTRAEARARELLSNPNCCVLTR